MGISISPQVTGNTITVTVSLTPPHFPPISATTIEGIPPTRVPISGTPMTPVGGTTDQFTFTVDGPGTYLVTVTVNGQSSTINVTVP